VNKLAAVLNDLDFHLGHAFLNFGCANSHPGNVSRGFPQLLEQLVGNEQWRLLGWQASAKNYATTFTYIPVHFSLNSY
jgi:hypothetical protein